MTELIPSLEDEIKTKRADFIASVDAVRETESALYIASHVAATALRGRTLQRMGIQNQGVIYRQNIEWHRAQEAFEEAGLRHLKAHGYSSLMLRIAFEHFADNSEGYVNLAAAQARSTRKIISLGPRELTERAS